MAEKGFWRRSALRSFLGAALMAVLLFILIATSIHYGIANLLGLTALASSALACCKTLLSWCLVSPTMFMTIMPWIGLGIMAAGLALAIFKAAKNLIISRRFLNTLKGSPAKRYHELKRLSVSYGIPIITFEDAHLNSAFTLGLIEPKVYISTGLIGKLSKGELAAVSVHELHHAERKDPLKLFILSFIKDLFFFIPLGHYLANLFFMRKELAADERAASETGRPMDLAQALLKMIDMRQETIPVGVPVLGESSLVEKRIKELLEPGQIKRDKVPVKIIIGTAAVVFILTSVFAAPIYAGGRQMEKCNHTYCLGPKRTCPANVDNCKKACDIMEKTKR